MSKKLGLNLVGWLGLVIISWSPIAFGASCPNPVTGVVFGTQPGAYSECGRQSSPNWYTTFSADTVNGNVVFGSTLVVNLTPPPSGVINCGSDVAFNIQDVGPSYSGDCCEVVWSGQPQSTTATPGNFYCGRHLAATCNIFALARWNGTTFDSFEFVYDQACVPVTLQHLTIE